MRLFDPVPAGRLQEQHSPTDSAHVEDLSDVLLVLCILGILAQGYVLCQLSGGEEEQDEQQAAADAEVEHAADVEHLWWTD